MADTRPELRPVDFDPFEPVPDRALQLALTEPQVEMWVAASMSREANCSYNQCFALAFSGPLRVESLRAALDRVVARHDALRAVIAPDGTGLEIRPPFAVPMPLVDLSGLDPAAQEREIEALLEHECETPFDLAEGPLIRATIVREGNDRHRFILTVHHIVCDGWSSSVLFTDMGLLYAADCAGVPAQLAPPASFRDYVTGLTGPDGLAAANTAAEYWTEQYSDGAPVLDLPLAKARPATKTYNCGRQQLRIDSELYADVKGVGATAGATLFTTLLAAFEVLVQRLSGQSDFVVGIPFAGQLELENSALVAHCVNTVPVRARVDPDATFVEHLRTVRERLSRAHGHSQITFGTLVRLLRIPRDGSRTPLVGITFTTDRIGAPFDFGDVAIASVATPKSYSNFELAINLVDSGSDIVVECDYNSDLFDEATIGRLLSHYETVLRGVVTGPDGTLGTLPLVVGGVVGGVGGGLVVPVGGCLHERFEEWVGVASGRVAVSCGGESLSFGELDRRANGLALRLRSLGVGPGVLVGLRLERSVGVVVGVLGILKAGGAYVPLDPAYPRERVGFMVADSGVGVVVTESGFVSDFEGSGLELVVVDDGGLGEAERGPGSGVVAGDLAYVMYTSGSTGKPKGVRVSHYNVTRLFDATEGWFGFGEDDVWTLFHSYAFDFSVWELWGALLYGGRLVVVPYWVSRSPEAFRELVLAEGVTVLNQTPSAFRQLLQADVESGPPVGSGLRYVIFGGEALELGSLRPWFERHGDRLPRLVNMYGITETTVHVTYRPVSLADLEAGLGSVIGVPIPDLRVFVCDPVGELVPTGVAGEMYVGGAGVSQGYLGRPELTAERFVPDRFSADPGSRLYRTGDLARRLENGELEYLGRIDDQVKVRGFRIELGEIEAAVREHPAVVDCVVVVREDVVSDKRLVAYLVGEGASLVEELRARLQQSLPEYMVPAHFVRLPRLPLTANGKTDRKALPAPQTHHEQTSRPYLPPKTPTEETIAAIWADVLGTPRISSNDNFFELGGDSLRAVQMVSTVRSAFGVDMAMRHLFERPTIAGLAEIIDLFAVSTGGVAAANGSEREEIEI